MTTTFDGSLQAILSWRYRETDDFGVRGESRTGKKYTFTVADGTGANQAQWVYRALRTVTPSTTTDDIDLFASLEDVLNIAVRAATIRLLAVKNLSETNGENLLVGGAGAGGNAWGVPWNNNQDAEDTVGPGDLMLKTNFRQGFAVTPTSGDILRILHAGVADIDYELTLWGTSEA